MSPQEGVPQEVRAGGRAEKVKPMTYGSQGYEVTNNTQIYQSVNQKGCESPTLTHPRAKYINLGI